VGHRPHPYPAPGSAAWPAGFGRAHEKKAALAVAHTLICIAWAVMTRGEDYAEAGEDYYEQRDHRNHEHLVRHHQHALARLGYQVTLIPPGDGRPPPATNTPPAAPGQAA
jgi:transposase